MARVSEVLDLIGHVLDLDVRELCGTHLPFDFVTQIFVRAETASRRHSRFSLDIKLPQVFDVDITLQRSILA